MFHKIAVIQTTEQFNLIYNEFKESAKINTSNNFLTDIFLIGLDIEFISQDNNPESFSNCLNWVQRVDKIAVCKLQLASSKLSLVIDLCKFNKCLPDNLIKILVTESWLKTGIGIANDLKYLSYNFNLEQCNGAIDIKLFALLKGCINPNLLDIYKNIAGNTSIDNIDKIKKKNYNVDWSEDMTIEQIEYAGTDAIMSYIIGEYFVNNIIKNPHFDKLKCEIDQNDGIIHKKSTSKILITTSVTNKNYIGVLQEYSQKCKINLPIYEDTECDNKNYNFKIECKFKGKITYGYGLNKKDAKTNSAQKMAENLQLI